MANPVSKTAYYCTGVRTLDAQQPNSLLHDTWAEQFMDADGRAFFDEFRAFTIPNASNVVRHHIIDELLRERLAGDPRRRIVLLGAGFDARAFRLNGGEWFEIDEAPIIERKNAVAPANQATNPLVRIAIDFASDSLEQTLTPLATDAPMTIVLEGVLYYLEPATVTSVLQTLQRVFPRHDLVCDLQSEAFVRKWGGPVIARIGHYGARWRWYPRDPISEVEALGYRLVSATSVALRTAELRRISIPAWVIRWFVPSLRDGYRVCAFERV